MAKRPQAAVDRRRLVSYSSLGGKIDPRLPISLIWILLMLTLILLIVVAQFVFPKDPYASLNLRYSRSQIPPENIPVRYDIDLKLYLPYKKGVQFGEKNFTFEGRLKITFECKKPNRKILLHSTRQNDVRVLLRSKAGLPMEVEAIKWFVGQELLHVETRDVMLAGETYFLYINYTSRFDNNGKTGIYTAPYKYNDEVRWTVVTHLQTMDARTVFPCVDNPASKAIFKTRVTHPTGTSAVSNTMELDIVEDGNWTTTVFEPTPIMSTYLFALCVSDFPYSETYTDKGVRVRVYTDPYKVNDTGTALDLVPRLLDYFEEYFGYEYILSKLDIFAAPAMRVLAMENWGLIICQQIHVVYRPDIYSAYDRRKITDLLGHEVAHQWFGNLVTLKWWNNMWLNEGFATMIGTKAADALENTTIRTNELEIEHYSRAYRVDQLDSAQPITIPDGVLFDPETQLNVVSYQKGACILRMFESTVGSDVYKEALQKYIMQHLFSNADHKDLLQTLAEVHKATVSRTHLNDQSFTLNDVLEKWIYQPGMPLLYVQKKKNSTNSWIVSQRQFKMNVSAPAYGQWKIPIFVRERKTKQPLVKWLVENSTVEVDIYDDYVIDGAARLYARIMYDEESFQRISDKLNEDCNAIPVSSRIRLIDDTFTYAEMGLLSYYKVFKFANYMQKEKSYTPTSVMSLHIDHLMNMFVTHKDFGLLRPVFHDLVNEEMKPENMTKFQDKLRELVFSRVCLTGYRPCVEHLLPFFLRVKVSCEHSLLSDANCNSIPPYLRSPVYAVAVLFGEQDNFEFLFTKWKAEIYQIERDRLFGGMAASTNKSNIHRLFHAVFFVYDKQEDIRIRALDHLKYLPKVNHYASFIKEHIEQLLLRFKYNDRVLSFTLDMYMRNLYSPNALKDYFEAEKRFQKASSRGLSLVRESLRRNQVMEDYRNRFARPIFGNLTRIFIEHNVLDEFIAEVGAAQASRERMTRAETMNERMNGLSR